MREDFELLKKYTYLDSACMSLKPKAVIDSMNEYYTDYCACAGRSSHKLGELVAKKVEDTRKKICKFAGFKEAIFIRNATEGINIIAKNFSGPVLISDKEHNSNLLPWQNRKIFVFKTSGSDEDIIKSFKEQIKNVKIASFVHVSNVDGQELPVEKLVKIAKKNNVITLIDGCQSVPHKKFCSSADYMVVSGHKMFGPTGTGALLVNKKHELKPLILGGGEVYDSTINSASFEKFPKNMEAGLQDYAGIIGFGKAVDYLKKAKSDYVKLNEEFATKIKNIGLVVEGSDNGITSFNVPGLECHEVALMLSQEGIMVRSGAHCCHSWYNKHKKEGTVRVSFYYYNSSKDVEKIISVLKKIKEMV